MKVGILFDLDGTLLNSLEDLTDSVNYTMAQYGCPQRTIEQVRQAIGNGAERLVRLSLPGKEDDPPVKEALAVFQRYYATHSQIKTRPYDGIPEALARLKACYPLAIVSNKPDMAVKPLCRDYFGEIYARGESDDCPRKPAPDMVLQTMAQLGVDACVYVGDSDVDVITAQNAWVPCLSVLWGFRARACLEAAGSKHFCDDPAMLPQILTELIEEYYGK